ncbi:flavin reductase family protein [Actinoplanes sp. NPDC026619]|uniref:flavin reductase family protein n=1 Tax=Actinoplanes sp. NPDC026619 TaxID=3155798 RepID=UPI0033E182FE
MSEDALAVGFRQVMAGVCTPVSVITAMDGERPHGTTVSAFTSLSMAPPMVLVSLDQSSALLAVLRATGRFGVNVLGSRQHTLASVFARKGDDKFDGVPWTLTHGVPRIADTPGWLACEVAQLVPGGDHVIALGTVTDADTLPADPLTYHFRAFGTHLPLPAR